MNAASTLDKERFIESVRAENERFYGTPEGRGILHAVLDLTFEQRWTYVLELVQNALDAGARHVAFRSSSEGVTLQHDGGERITERSVRALSKLSQSTKGAAAVGFMGIGFKSVFRRYRRVSISGFGWSFGYYVNVQTGERFGDQHLDLLGAVCPTWDSSIPAPEAPYTTRFELGVPRQANFAFGDDISALIGSDGDWTLLALLGHRGLERLTIDGADWELKIGSGSDRAISVAHAGDERRWQLFISPFQPSRAAVARFLERRRLLPSGEEADRVYAEAQREREVIAILPIKDGQPEPPAVGRVFATLPTAATWPPRIHLQADWLVNLSRTGLPELEDNEWQDEIVAAAPAALAHYVAWLTSGGLSVAALTTGFSAIRSPDEGHRTALDESLSTDNWLAEVGKALREVPFVPAWLGDSLTFRRPAEVALVPKPLRYLANERNADAHVLFGRPCAATSILSEDFLGLVVQAGLLKELSPDDVDALWATSLPVWWDAQDKDEPSREERLLRLWSALEQLIEENEQWMSVRCVRTESQEWLGLASVIRVDGIESLHGDDPGRQLLERLRSHLPPQAQQLSVAVSRRLHEQRLSTADWSRRAVAFSKRIPTAGVKDAIASAVRTAIGQDDERFLVLLAQWARQHRQGKVLMYLVGARDGTSTIDSPDNLVLAAPYSEHEKARRSMWPSNAVVSPVYLETDPYHGDAGSWRTFFEDLGCLGPVRTIDAPTQISQWNPDLLMEFGGLTRSEVPEVNYEGYFVVDRVFSPEIATAQLQIVADWLETDFTRLSGRGSRHARWKHRRDYSMVLKRRASWVEQLEAVPWVPTAVGTFERPSLVLTVGDPARPEATIARLSPALVNQLNEEGLRFGTAIPRAPAHRQLRYGSAGMSATDIAENLRQLLQEMADGAEGAGLEELLREIVVPLSNGRRVSYLRLVRRIGVRSTLGGWVESLEEVPEPLRSVLGENRLPVQVPDVTSGAQALSYLQHVWERAKKTPAGLADETRRLLPLAYGYVLDDSTRDTGLAKAWLESRDSAMVFGSNQAGRLWTGVRTPIPPVWDDLGDPFLRSLLDSGVTVATGGHLGDTFEARAQVAKALSIRSLSETLRPQWLLGARREEPEWSARFEIVMGLLAAAQELELPSEALVLSPFDSISVEVRGERRSVGARHQGSTLQVGGEPHDFADEAAALLVQHFGVEDQTRVVAATVTLMASLADARRFDIVAGRFAAAFSPGVNLQSPITDRGVVEPIREAPAAVLVERPNGLGPSDRAQFDARHSDDLKNASERLIEAIAGSGGGNIGRSEINRERLWVGPPAPVQQQRGRAGEDEFIRRCDNGVCAGLRILRDRRADGCGYDFDCAGPEESVLEVEVKTFLLGGSVFVTPGEWERARVTGSRYWMVGIEASDRPASAWSIFLLPDPYGVLMSRGTWRLTANLEVAAADVFQTDGVG